MSAGEANTAVEVAAGHVTGLRERLARIEQLAHTRAMRGAAPVPASSLLPVDAAARPRVHPLVDAAPQPSPLIVKSNRLIEASYQLTLAEQRVLLCVVAQIDRYPGAAPVTADTPFEVTARGLAELFGLPKKQAYALMVHGGEKFAERWVIIDAPDPAQPRLTQTKTRWVHKIDYLPAAGTLRLYLAPAVISYLTHLASEFTHYHLISVARMTTPYALRLYELLLQWLKRGERIVLRMISYRQRSLATEYNQLPRIDVNDITYKVLCA